MIKIYANHKKSHYYQKWKQPLKFGLYVVHVQEYFLFSSRNLKNFRFQVRLITFLYPHDCFS